MHGYAFAAPAWSRLQYPQVVLAVYVGLWKLLAQFEYRSVNIVPDVILVDVFIVSLKVSEPRELVQKHISLFQNFLLGHGKNRPIVAV